VAEVSLKSSSAKQPEYAPLVVNLTNEETRELVKYEYEVRRISKKEGVQIQLEIAEFARTKDGQTIAGLRAFSRMLDDLKVPEGAPAFVDLFDLVDDEGGEELIKALQEAAFNTSVGQ
jgi:hypothetical protein